MGYVPPKPPMRLNIDRFGLPRDFATYEWVMYGSVVHDDSPARRAFLATRVPGAPSRPSVTRAVRA